MSKSLKSLIREPQSKTQSITQSQRKTKAKPKTEQVTSVQNDVVPDPNQNSETTELSETLIQTNNLIYPCKNDILHTKITLHPHQIQTDLYLNLKKNLINKVEKKCTKDGFITKVHKITNSSNGILSPENFTSAAVCDVEYVANICYVAVDIIIIAKIASSNTNMNFLLSVFGNIIRIITACNTRDLNTKVFTIGNDKSIIHIPTQHTITTGDYVKIQIKSIKFFQNDTVIKCMGVLYDMPTQEEIQKFAYKDDVINTVQFEEQTKNVYYNEENEIEDTVLQEQPKNENSNYNEI